MRKTREILRMKWSVGLSHRRIASALRVSVGVVGETASRAKRAELDWEQVLQLSDDELEERLYGRRPAPAEEADGARPRPLPDYREVHAQRRRHGVTLALLHWEYSQEHPDGYGYTQFCEYYRRWLGTRGLTMRMEHLAGDKLFVDYSGKKPVVVDPVTGEAREVELFVAALGASNHTYVEATETQRVHDFIASHVRTFEFLGGVPAALVPDQLKSGVTVACRYEPGLQRTYEDLAEHYGTAIVPARPGKPRDKAKVEVAVQVVQRWILARLRNQTFFSLDELNARIRELRDELAERRMRKYGLSRRELFERTDLPALRPLPAAPYELASWSKANLGSDYHVEVDGHAYSVPHRLVGRDVEMRATANTVEVLCGGKRVAVHVRGQRGGKTTKPDHLPVAHRKHLEWTPERILGWAASVGEATSALASAILQDRPHPEQGYKSCLGLLRLEKRYGRERLERACARALCVEVRSYRNVESMLRAGLDRLDLVPPAEPRLVAHENVRGASYYEN
jgi:transposase